jgi:hypothetical protein
VAELENSEQMPRGSEDRYGLFGGDKHAFYVEYELVEQRRTTIGVWGPAEVWEQLV